MNLRPFEDLIKPIEYDGKTFVPIEEIAKMADWHIELSNPVITAEIIHKYNTSACKANIKEYIKDCIKEYSLLITANFNITKYSGRHSLDIDNQVQIVKNLIKWGFIEP